MIGAGRATGREREHEGPRTQYEIGTAGEKACDIETRAHATIGQERHVGTHGLPDKPQHFRHRLGRIQLAAAVVRDDNRVGADRLAKPGVLGIQYPFYDQPARPVITQAFHFLGRNMPLHEFGEKPAQLRQTGIFGNVGRQVAKPGNAAPRHGKGPAWAHSHLGDRLQIEAGRHG